MSGATDMSFGPLKTYVEIEGICRRMLDAAQRDDWDEVASLEKASRDLIAAARRDACERLSPQERREKFRILSSIVRIDAELRHLAQPWQRGIDRMLSPGSRGSRPDSPLT